MRVSDEEAHQREDGDLLFRSCRRRRVSSRDGLVPLVKAVLGLGMAGVDGMGDFSLKTSGVGREGRCGGSV